MPRRTAAELPGNNDGSAKGGDRDPQDDERKGGEQPELIPSKRANEPHGGYRRDHHGDRANPPISFLVSRLSLARSRWREPRSEKP